MYTEEAFFFIDIKPARFKKVHIAYVSLTVIYNFQIMLFLYNVKTRLFYSMLLYDFRS